MLSSVGGMSKEIPCDGTRPKASSFACNSDCMMAKYGYPGKDSFETVLRFFSSLLDSIFAGRSGCGPYQRKCTSDGVDWSQICKAESS
jgi:hypothetical protein